MRTTTSSIFLSIIHKIGSYILNEHTRCYRGRSRSATVVVAFLMQKHGYSAERALAKVRSKREIIQPHDSFLAQLRLYESMDFSIDPENLQFKMFK